MFTQLRNESRHVTAAVTGPATLVVQLMGRNLSILHGELIGHVLVLALRDDKDTVPFLYSDHQNSVNLITDIRSRVLQESRLRSMNGRSYYRWILELLRDGRAMMTYTRGHSAELTLPAQLNREVDHYASGSQRFLDLVPVAPAPTFMMDTYTLYTTADGWIESNTRNFVDYFLAEAAAAKLELGNRMRMLTSVHDNQPPPEYPYTRALSAHSAVIQLYARSGGLRVVPTANALLPYPRVGLLDLDGLIPTLFNDDAPRSAASPRQGRIPTHKYMSCSGAAAPPRTRTPPPLPKHCISAAIRHTCAGPVLLLPKLLVVLSVLALPTLIRIERNGGNELVVVLAAVDGAGTSYAPRDGYPNRVSPCRIFSALSIADGVSIARRGRVKARLRAAALNLVAVRTAVGPAGHRPQALYGFNGGAYGLTSSDSRSDWRWGWRPRGGWARAAAVERAPAPELGLARAPPTPLYLYTQNGISISSFGEKTGCRVLTLTPPQLTESYADSHPPKPETPASSHSQSPSPHPHSFPHKLHTPELPKRPQRPTNGLKPPTKTVVLYGSVRLTAASAWPRRGAAGRGKAAGRQSAGRRTDAGSALPTRARAEGDVLLHGAVAAGVMPVIAIAAAVAQTRELCGTGMPSRRGAGAGRGRRRWEKIRVRGLNMPVAGRCALVSSPPAALQTRWAKAVNSAPIPPCFSPSSSMDPQADSDEEFIVVSTSDCTESASAFFPQAGGLKSSAELFVKSIGFLPSLLGARVTEFQASGTTRTDTRKYSETLWKQIVDQRSVTNYNYIINGEGEEGSGGEGGDQGGDGGTGQGPTVYFGQAQAQEPSGDVKLVGKEVVVGRLGRGMGVRRTVYHAEIRGDPGTVTVAMYQGDGAEEEWGQDVAKYESIRHPNIVQLYGLVSTKRLYAMVFHDELIPYDQFLRRFQHSSILTTYIFAYCRIMKDVEFNEASDYIDDVSPKISRDSSVWIRCATGELCLDLAQGGPSMSSRFVRWWPIDRLRDMIRLENLSLDAPDSEDMIISSLSEDRYHEHGTCLRITEPLQILSDKELHWEDYTGEAPGMPLAKNKAWLAQANHIFAELEEVIHAKDYVLVDRVQFSLRITDQHHIPDGYLFVCPPQDFCTSTKPHANLYQWPACPAYWSLNPSGADRLSTEDARILRFPAIHMETVVQGWSWDHSIYEGLQRFHEGKGHDPESWEVAKQLGYPLYEVSSERVPFPAREVKYPSLSCDLQDPGLCREWGHYL
ncbi:hypothetical protein MSAN_02281000 [Mycena sanguinolenta]|uniref:Protein kinase domain-containing protein n=1 Tax=Mycena sanguinolenta TaxID=230812 RepID=A0A8H7CH78_9AGAR|nr:hypothetical protein MSAN_02281000 [Mycena sanguinolenta]